MGNLQSESASERLRGNSERIKLCASGEPALRELLLEAPQREYTAPYGKKLLPLKEELGVEKLALEIMKTGGRMGLTIRSDPGDDAVRMQDTVKLKEYLSTLAREVIVNTQNTLTRFPWLTVRSTVLEWYLFTHSGVFITQCRRDYS